MSHYDVIIIGAGSIGVPATMEIAKSGLKVLCVDKNSSPGQGDNKHAIGGIRATHSQKAKIWVGLRSLEIISGWEKKFGDDIEWIKGGYLFVSYHEREEKILKETVKYQKQQGLNISWINAEKVKEIVPGINENNLLGGTYSPDDGHINSLLVNHAYYAQALNADAEFKFKEQVIDIESKEGGISAVKTTKGTYSTNIVINAAGAHAQNVANMAGIEVPVMADMHEAGITEPIERFFSPMVVDIHPKENPTFGNSKNYYFYQNKMGQVIFCITPDPPLYGLGVEETSQFLPQVSQRMLKLLPRLKNIKVRRTWRGRYPGTPDGSPIIGCIKGLEGYFNMVGMGGQGLMLGPGLSEIAARYVNDKLTPKDREILEEFSIYRDFSKEELLK